MTNSARQALVTTEARDGDLGPAMLALTEQQRKFVLALFDAPHRRSRQSFAAKAAGYGRGGSNAHTIAQMAHHLVNRPSIQAAIAEVSTAQIVALGPLATHALKNLLSDPRHREHGRAVGLALERVAPAMSEHKVRVEHDVTKSTVTTAVALARIAELASQFGVNLPAAPVIDARPDRKTEASS